MLCGFSTIPTAPNRKSSLAIFADFRPAAWFTGIGRKGPVPAKSETRPPRKKKDQSGRRILIIEDDPFSLELFTYLLEFSGHEVVQAVNGEEGLAAVRGETPDLIICDVKLPKVGGCEVVRDLKADPALRRIPVIAVTALGNERDRGRFLACGFDGYIPKPIVAETFARQIVNFLTD